MAAFRHLLFAALLAGSSPSLANGPEAQPAETSGLSAEAREAAAVVDAFHAALRGGDTAAALAMLAEDVLIFEGGGVERSKAEYASHHLEADAAFSKAVTSTLTRRAGGVSGDLAWVASEGRTAGEYKGRPVDRVTAETMLLRRSGGAWKIVHIHWSSGSN
ncbi:MAG: YybH family protein [Alphaproteobacteria bacterium]